MSEHSMDGHGREELTNVEILELARAFPPAPGAGTLLRRARFPREHLPAPTGMTSAEFWSAVAEAVLNGVMPNGRARILAAACAVYPDNPVFRTADAIRRVLVVGASPAGTGRLRADREARAIREAAGSLTVDYWPAAQVTDLRRMVESACEMVHLVCHGESGHLVFEDSYGEPHRVPAEQIAGLLRVYGRLRALVLASCDSEAVARRFTTTADTVIAHRGPLDDETAVVFAGELYGLLDKGLPPCQAARIAVEQTCVSLGDAYGEALRANLIVLCPGAEGSTGNRS